MDLLYFGEDLEALDSRDKAKANLQEALPDAILKEDNDPYKGYRLSVEYDESQKEEYYVWAIKNGFFYCSLTLQMEAAQNPKMVIELIKKTKEQDSSV